jgi:hypothetical protein
VLLLLLLLLQRYPCLSLIINSLPKCLAEKAK